MDTSRARTSRSRQNASGAEPGAAGGAGGARKTGQVARTDSALVDPLDPSLIVRTLRAVADELERDPGLASRVVAASGLAALPHAPTDPKAPRPASDPGEGDDTGSARPAGRTARAFQPRIVTGASTDLGPGIPDPFALRARLGPDGFAVALADLRLGTLRAILREYALDPDGRIGKQNDASRIRAHIAQAVETR